MEFACCLPVYVWVSSVYSRSSPTVQKHADYSKLLIGVNENVNVCDEMAPSSGCDPALHLKPTGIGSSVLATRTG